MGDVRGGVKGIVSAIKCGFSLSQAIRVQLGMSLSEYAASRGFRYNEVSMCLNGYPSRVYGRIRDAVAEDVGIGRADLDALIDRFSQRESDHHSGGK